MNNFTKRFCKGGAFLGFILASLPLSAADITVNKGEWQITYTETSKTFSIQCEGQVLINSSSPTVTYEDKNGTEQTVNPSSFAQMEKTETDICDEFGTGKCITFSFQQPDNGNEVVMQHRFYLYDNHADYIITDLSISGDAEIRSNYLAPISVNSAYALFSSANSNNRILRVPFDNDDYNLRYGEFKMTQEVTSYEVSALFEGESRHGLILGSVDHNHWKSAVKVNASNNNTINSLTVFSGVSDTNTRDFIPHGKLDGPVITSARMFIGWFNDWRDGMDEFGRANTTVVPKRDTWKYGTPFGWQSWGVMQGENSYEADKEISDYYKNTLVPGGFCSPGGGPTVLSLDASDQLTDDQRKELATRYSDQIVGNYNTPFSCWYDDNTNLDSYLGTDALGNNYTLRDVVLKANGNPIQVNSGQKCYALDPTHPHVIESTKDFIRNHARMGIKYMKWDFMNCGITQADSYYRKEIKTAVEAYNYGLTEIMKVADECGIFIAWSIAPLFPYQYANSRRIACDTFSDISDTEYSMNAVTGGWWTDELFQFNDPDHIVMVGRRSFLGKQVVNTSMYADSEGENRARYTNGIITGMMLMGDNLRESNEAPGGPALSRERAQKIMLNKDVNEIARTGKTFRPVYGYKGYNGNETDAENFFMYHTPSYLYVAVINYKTSSISGNLPLSDLGITASEVGEAKELWSGSSVTLSNDALPYSVAKSDACIYRLSKNANNGALTFQCNKEADRNMFGRSHRTTPIVADFNNDGFMDFYYGGTSGYNNWAAQSVLAIGGEGGFDCLTEGTGLPKTAYGPGSKAFDFNNDGLMDFIFLNNGGNDTGTHTGFVLVKNEGNNKFSVVEDDALASIRPVPDNENPSENNFNENAQLNCLSIGDYDKDGYPDLLIQDYVNGRKTQLLKNINGERFEVQEVGLSQMSGGAVAFADMNQDGWLDIIAIGYNNGYEGHIYLNQQNGTFIDTVLDNAISNELIFDQDKKEASLFVMDFDQDGRTDFLLNGRFGTGSSKNESRFLLFRNVSEGNGVTFEIQKTQFLPVGEPSYNFLPCLADLNGDGFADYIGYGWNPEVGNWTFSVSVSTENGLYFNTTENPNISYGERSVAYGDMNGDGLLDFVSNNWGDDCDQIYYNVNTTKAESVIPALPENPTVAYNGQTRQLTVKWTATKNNNGSGNMYNLFLKDKESGKMLRMLVPAHENTGMQKAYMEFANYAQGNTYTFEHVEEGEYVVGIQAVTCGWNASGFVTVEVNTTLDTAPATTYSFTCDEVGDRTTFPRSHRTCPLVADFNNDGIMDIYYGGTSQYTGWSCPNNIVYGGTDGFTVKENVSGLPKTSYGQGSKAFDFNQDGYVDFIFMNTGGNNSGTQRGYVLVKNNGDGTFTTMNDPALGSITTAATSSEEDACKFNDKAQLNSISIGDYDKDGYPDLLIQNKTENGGFTKVLRNINGEHFEVQDFTDIHQVYGGAVAFVDLNNDGWLDIIVHGKNADGLYEVQLYRNTKDGNFVIDTPVKNGYTLSYYMSIHSNDDAVMYVADYDQDGKADILINGECGMKKEKTFTCFRNTSDDETFSFEEIPTGFLPLGGSPTRLTALGDFNGDGFVDHIGYGWNQVDGGWPLATSASTSLMTYENATTNPGIVYKEGGVMNYGDLNGDGLLDFICSGGGDDYDQIFFSKNTTRATPIAIMAPSKVTLDYDGANRKLTATWPEAINGNGSRNMYNVYIEKDGKTFMLAPANKENGKQQACTDFGSYLLGQSHTFENIGPGSYTVGVQSVSYSWNASAFTTASLLVLDENTPTEIYNMENTDVVVARTMKAGIWNTFCVPFNMTTEQLTENHITDVRQYSQVETNGDSHTMTFSEVDNIEAGMPYLVKTDNALTTLYVKDVTVKADQPVPVTFGNVTMTGNYETQTIGNGEFFISNNAFYYADQPVTVKGFRAIVGLTEGANANSMLFWTEGETTTVEKTCIFHDQQEVDVYSLSGILLRKDVKPDHALEGLEKGIYIVNGKKVVKP